MANNISYPPGAQQYDVPLIGGDLAKIGRIIDLFAEPCKPTAEIWVYAYFQALPTLFISILKPELIDIDIPHRRGKPRKGRIGRFIAAQRFTEQLITIPVPRWVVFRIYEWGQRIGWYFLVADAFENFAINWMSTAYRYNGCQTPTQCWGVGTTTHTLTGSGIAPWPRATFFTSNSGVNMNFPGNLFAPALTGKFRITYDMSFEPYIVPAQSEMPYATCIMVNGQVFNAKELSFGPGGKKVSSDSMILETNLVPQPRIGVGLYFNNSGKFCYRSGELNVYRTTDNELSADP